MKKTTGCQENTQGRRVLTTSQVADYLQTTTVTLLKMVREGKLKANKIGREYRFLQEELDGYLRGKTKRKKPAERKQQIRKSIFEGPPTFGAPSPDVFREYKISPGASRLYRVLALIEDDFIRAGKKPEVFYGDDGSIEEKDFFWATTKELTALTSMLPSTIRDYRRELEQAELIQSWKYQRPVLTREGKIGGTKTVTAYRLLIKRRDDKK